MEEISGFKQKLKKMAKKTSSKKQQQRRGISMLLLISISFAFMAVLFFKIYSLSGDVITPPCGGGSTLVKFNVYGSYTQDANNDGALNRARVSLQPTNKDCMYSDKTINGYAEFPTLVPGTYKLVVDQKDLNKGKSLCDKYKETITIDVDSEYDIILTNCNQHSFNLPP